MKSFCLIALFAMAFSSCLKQSIPDAMLGASAQSTGGTATLSYKFNGNAVSISVPNPDNQNPNLYTLGCTKSNSYILDGISNTGEITFNFYTDSLKTGNYIYTHIYQNTFFISYNGTNAYIYGPSDSMSYNITSYKNGHISGNFSGLLTPILDPNNNTYGAMGSISITNGVFQNVPIFY